MKLSTRRDIEAPQAFVYACLADFAGWERSAVRKGAEVNRSDADEIKPGTSWRIRFAFRGKMRTLTAKLAEVDDPRHLGISLESTSFDGGSELETMQLSARRTRLMVGVTVKPKTLAARLFLHSLKLAKGKLQRRFDGRVAAVAADIEDRYKRSQLATARA